MERALILEDDLNMRLLLNDVLQSLDYEVKSAASALEAIQVGKDAQFELMVTDIRMAGPLDGLGVLKLLKEANPQMASIVITGFADQLAPPRALEIRVDDYLLKPFDVSDVVDSVERVRQSQQQRSWYRQVIGKLFRQTLPQEVLGKLQSKREECLKNLYIAVRSGFLYVETALACWDIWEDLETQYMRLSCSPSSSAESIAQLLERYQAWERRLLQYSMDETLAMPTPRTAEKVSRPVFAGLIERIRAGKVSSEELAVAVVLRRLDPSTLQLSREREALHQKIWG